ncbi:LPXTG cell wall anchor domain-containing protein [Streptococcus ratti]|uniref:LPXTG cell wall anchor domain-containing protein n=1 Tax=Streptococcus ratti TaxID=1341 RepID=UPI0009DA58F8|nr:LPXTG cell wall anchor domain-containing protein [Streptococcus ratti]
MRKISKKQASQTTVTYIYKEVKSKEPDTPKQPDTPKKPKEGTSSPNDPGTTPPQQEVPQEDPTTDSTPPKVEETVKKAPVEAASVLPNTGTANETGLTALGLCLIMGALGLTGLRRKKK